MIATALLLVTQAIVTVALPWPLQSLLNELSAMDLGLTSEALIPVPFWGALGPLNITQIMTGLFAFVIFLTVLSAALDHQLFQFLSRLCLRSGTEFRNDLVLSLLKSRQSFMEHSKSMDLATRLSRDIEEIQSVFAEGLIALFRSAPTVFLIVYLTVALNEPATPVVLSAIPLIYLLNEFFLKKIRQHGSQLRNERAQFEQDARWVFSSLFSIKSMTSEDSALESLHNRNRQMLETTQSLERMQAAMTTSLDTVSSLVIAAAIMAGGSVLLGPMTSLGGLALSIVYIALLRRPLGDIARFSSRLPHAIAAARRLNQLRADLESQIETEGTLSISSLPFPDAVSVHFEQVSFAHRPQQVILDRFSADFEAGELIALAGPSGVGRSTFARLMNRMLDPLEGRILLGRTDLRRFRLHTLRESVTFVHRDPYFAHGTILQNLMMGIEETDIDEQKLSEVLYASTASEFVNSLPDRLHTIIGEGGLHLTSRQGKALQLARAFLRTKSRVLIFDEPTEGFDESGAEMIFTALHRLAENGALVFFITQSPVEIKHADRIIFFSGDGNPRVSTHPALESTSDPYRHFITRRPPPPPEIRA